MSNENKYKNFVFTWNADAEGFLPPSVDVQAFLSSNFKEYLFQKEIGEETKREHYQGYVVSDIRKRKTTLLNEFSDSGFSVTQLTLNPMQGTLEQNALYCSKQTSSTGELFSNRLIYTGKDIQILDDKSKRFRWQQKLFEYFFEEDVHVLKTPESSREIVWCYDMSGNSGKSLFTKWISFRNNNATKVAFGSAQQLRSALVTIGPRQLFILDIPRTLGEDDSLRNIYSVIEDLKNGFIVSSFYGTHKELLMDSPHILIFSNMMPDTSYLSDDRWKIFTITGNKDLR
jgi:hypothetical protein